MRLVASPISWAVAITSLLTSAAKTASKPAASASWAMERISAALQPTPGTRARPNRSAIVTAFRCYSASLRDGVDFGQSAACDSLTLCRAGDDSSPAFCHRVPLGGWGGDGERRDPGGHLGQRLAD